MVQFLAALAALYLLPTKVTDSFIHDSSFMAINAAMWAHLVNVDLNNINKNIGIRSGGLA